MFLGLLIHFIITLIILHGVSVTSQICSNSYSRPLCRNPSGDPILYPFWLKDGAADGSYCGYPGLSISCREERQVINISNHLYYVQGISYELKFVRMVDVDIEGSDCPQPRHNLSLQSTAFSQPRHNLSLQSTVFSGTPTDGNTQIYYNCTKYPQEIQSYEYLPCLDHVDRNVTLRSFRTQPKRGFDCEETVELPYLYDFNNSNYTQWLKFEFLLVWDTPSDSSRCEDSGGYSLFNETTSAYNCFCYRDYGDYSVHESVCPHRGLSIRMKIIIGVCTGAGALLILILLLSYRRVLFSTCCSGRDQSNVEVFLKNCGPLATQKYKYSDIKKMTDSFKEKLGQGGFGSVFKGKITDGRLVAVKVLNDSKSNGEDFINEVATISRTNHVNVVNLIGFCSDGSKRALVYEFMPNGSLEKFIYNVKTSSTPSILLGWEKLYQIALGIARGLEYLHRGCNTRILHFDIKPHNILLDEEFCPKIADFGLAKLCPTKESIVSMLVARGTIGYIAPEVYCRNFGGVSHKSDVYSYGMMVLEMIGGRKNIDVSVENMSEIYFPQWIYNHFKLDVSVDGCGDIFDDPNARKMITVALWCIQTQPAARPSITRVVEMLEGNTEEVEMPPNPFQDPPSSSSP